MTNELTTTNRATGVALATSVSPWREAADKEIGANFGSFLKFAKGDWTLGEDEKEVPAEIRFVANLEEYYRGWMRWWDGKLTARKLGRRTIITDDDLRQFLAGLPRAGGHEQG